MTLKCPSCGGDVDQHVDAHFSGGELRRAVIDWRHSLPFCPAWIADGGITLGCDLQAAAKPAAPAPSA